jgi:hypothetical protein
MMASMSSKKDHTKNNTEGETKDETTKAGFVQPGKNRKGVSDMVRLATMPATVGKAYQTSRAEANEKPPNSSCVKL